MNLQNHLNGSRLDQNISFWAQNMPKVLILDNSGSKKKNSKQDNFINVRCKHVSPDLYYINIRVEVLTMGGATISILFLKWAKNTNFCNKVLEKHEKSKQYRSKLNINWIFQFCNIRSYTQNTRNTDHSFYRGWLVLKCTDHRKRYTLVPNTKLQFVLKFDKNCQVTTW